VLLEGRIWMHKLNETRCPDCACAT
jgi:hypothetical protein